MRILILSWYFPPRNAIGGIRVGKLARYLHESGHDIRVVTVQPPPDDTSLPVEIPKDKITYTGWSDVNSLPSRIQSIRKKRAQTPQPSGGNDAEPSGLSALLRAASNAYVNLTNWPDRHIGWVPHATGAARRLCRDWRPDLIFASGPPFSGLIAGHRLSRQMGVPWIAELRDRWADDPYFEAPDWRRALLHRMERRIVGSAKAIVTVTPPWADFYQQKYRKPVATIYNGFDEREFPAEAAPDAPPSPFLDILYTGGIYPGRRDPSALFQALSMLGAEAEGVRVRFIGTAVEHVAEAARRFAIEHLVEIRPPVPYQQAIAEQRRADILLLLQWNNPREQGNCPAKLFEYIAVRRPILGIGLEDGVPAKIIREREAGFFSSDPAAIAAQLRLWLGQKAKHGRLPPTPQSCRDGLSRDVQFAKLERFLLNLLGQSPRPQTAPAKEIVS